MKSQDASLQALNLKNSFELEIFFFSDMSTIHIKQLTKSLSPRCKLSTDIKIIIDADAMLPT